MKPTPREFAEALADNEQHMDKMAAIAVTCDQFGISEKDGYNLLIDSADEDEDEL